MNTHQNSIANPTAQQSTRHGWLNSPISRAEFCFQQGWFNSWLASEVEGMKNFPADSISPLVWFQKEVAEFGAPFPDSTEFANDGGALPRQIPDGLILSAGREDSERVILNCTDDELMATKGVKWPVTDVKPGQVLDIKWNTPVVHATRGYRYFITKEGWDHNKRLTRADLELAPFYSIFNTKREPWGPNLQQDMPVHADQKIVLPTQKTGRHIILAIWLVADSAAGFYHTIDVNFVE